MSLKTISASKYHSYGNDFLVVPAGQISEEQYSRFAVNICDTHRGVGADGCILVKTSPQDGAFAVRIFNRDGSEAGMSGNGTRCACAFLHQHGHIQGPLTILQTSSGRKQYHLHRTAAGSWAFRSNLGLPQFHPAKIPFEAAKGLEEVQDLLLEAGGQQVKVSAVSVGNPQCVVFVDEFPDRSRFERIGAALERHPRFPERTNVSFAKVEGVNQIRIQIWERGVGPTFSSGTGACGAAVCAIRQGKVQPPVRVVTETGVQIVDWSLGREIVLSGEAVFIAEIQFYWGEGDASRSD
ncbi:MAG: diaminopimelate epimerase [Acidobacteria bacterium]|nr:diaminopimelate epimerase [Acidobacteriota bacterium]